MSRKTQRNATQIRRVVHAILGGVSTAAACTPLFAQTAPAADTSQSSDELQEVVDRKSVV